MTLHPDLPFQPTMLGQRVEFEDEGHGIITDETVTSIYIESDFFTGWMTKQEYRNALGVSGEDHIFNHPPFPES